MKRVSEGGFGKGEVQETAFEYGVVGEDVLSGNEVTILVDDEHEAYDVARLVGGKPVMRAVHSMAWAELEA